MLAAFVTLAALRPLAGPPANPVAVAPSPPPLAPMAVMPSTPGAGALYRAGCYEPLGEDGNPLVRIVRLDGACKAMADYAISPVLLP